MPAPIQPPLWGPDISGTYLGTMVGQHDDPDSPHPELFALRAAERIGSADGWASFADAAGAVERLTYDDAGPGAAIIEHDGRYYAAGLVAKDLTGTTRHPDWSAFDWDADGNRLPGDWYMSSSRHLEAAGVVRIVDGEWDVYTAPRHR